MKYTTSYALTEEQKERIIDLYKHNYSGAEIKQMLRLPQTERTIQRVVHNAGIARSVGDAFRLAHSKGRITYQRTPEYLKIKRKKLSTKLRFQVLIKDNFSCRLCGSKAPNVLEVDHIDNNKNNNQIDNLRTLCEDCNKGRFYNGY